MPSRIGSFVRRSVLVLVAAVIVGAASPAEAIEPQRAANWCWASAVQDVVAQKAGFYQSQAQIAARLTGWPMDRPAYPQEVAALLQSFGLHGFMDGALQPDQMAALLGSGAKVIALIDPSGGQEGHFVVLEGALPNALIVADPATGMTRTIPWQTIYGWNWIQSVVVR